MRAGTAIALSVAIAVAIGFALKSGRKEEGQPSAAAQISEVARPGGETPPAPVLANNTPSDSITTANLEAPKPVATLPVQPQIPPQPTPVALASPRPAGRPTQPVPVEDAAVEGELFQVQLMLRGFRDAVGENPIGTNAEIVSAVLGDNIKQARVGTPENQHLNDKGELVDRWGTPYFFHQVSKTQMEVRSAGPDKVMWTGDDKQL